MQEKLEYYICAVRKVFLAKVRVTFSSSSLPQYAEGRFEWNVVYQAKDLHSMKGHTIEFQILQTRVYKVNFLQNIQQLKVLKESSNIFNKVVSFLF